MKAITLPFSPCLTLPTRMPRLKTRIVFGIRLRIGHINDVFGVDENPAGRAVPLPFFDLVAVLIEDLNPVVITVTHKQASYGIEGQRKRSVKFARTTAFLSPSLDELFPSLENLTIRCHSIC